MDRKKELSQIHAMLGIALENCEVSLRAPRTDSTQLDGVLETVERVAVRLRTAAESIRPAQSESSRKPDAPKIPALVGEIEVTEFGWVHITLNTLLPGCKYKTPLWLENTLAALLLRSREHGRKLPKFQSAMLIIEERCYISNRRSRMTTSSRWRWRCCPAAPISPAATSGFSLRTTPGNTFPSAPAALDAVFRDLNHGRVSLVFCLFGGHLKMSPALPWRKGKKSA